MTVAVLAAHQGRQRTIARDLAHRWLDIADREADAPVVGRVRTRGMEQVAVMHRGLTGLQFGIDAVFFIDLHGKGYPKLKDILLLFIYLEVLAMVGIYFKTKRLPVVFLLYIAITALTRVLTVDVKTISGSTPARR